MKKTDALAHFDGVSKLAEALGVKPSAVSQWSEELPILRQIQLQTITGGALQASEEAQRFIAPAALPQEQTALC